MPQINDEILELIEAKYAIEFKYAKGLIARPMPEDHDELRAEVRFAINEYLTDEEINNMRAEKREVFKALHERHMGLTHNSFGRLE